MKVGVGTYGADGISVVSWNQGTDLYIGNYCSIAPKVEVLLGGNHRHTRATTFPVSEAARVQISSRLVHTELLTPTVLTLATVMRT